MGSANFISEKVEFLNTLVYKIQFTQDIRLTCNYLTGESQHYYPQAKGSPPIPKAQFLVPGGYLWFLAVICCSWQLSVVPDSYLSVLKRCLNELYVSLSLSMFLSLSPHPHFQFGRGLSRAMQSTWVAPVNARTPKYRRQKSLRRPIFSLAFNTAFKAC